MAKVLRHVFFSNDSKRVLYLLIAKQEITMIISRTNSSTLKPSSTGPLVTTLSKTNHTIDQSGKSTQIEIELGISASINISGTGGDLRLNDNEDVYCGSLYEHDHFEGEFEELNHRDEIESFRNNNNILSSLEVNCE